MAGKKKSGKPPAVVEDDNFIDTNVDDRDTRSFFMANKAKIAALAGSVTGLFLLNGTEILRWKDPDQFVAWWPGNDVPDFIKNIALVFTASPYGYQPLVLNGVLTLIAASSAIDLAMKLNADVRRRIGVYKTGVDAENNLTIDQRITRVPGIP